MAQKKAPLINYLISNEKSSRRNKTHSITLELKHVINHCDISRGVCATSVSAKEKRSFAEKSRNIKSNLNSRRFRFTHKIITAEHMQEITETIHI